MEMDVCSVKEIIEIIAYATVLGIVAWRIL